MTTDYFTSKWIMTVFACFLPYDQLPAIFDMFLMDGWRAVFRIGIALLREMESSLLTMDMVDMCSYFRDNVRKERVTSDFRLFSSAARVRVNPILVPFLSPNLHIDSQQRAWETQGTVLHNTGWGQTQINSFQLGEWLGWCAQMGGVSFWEDGSSRQGRHSEVPREAWKDW